MKGSFCSGYNLFLRDAVNQQISGNIISELILILSPLILSA